MEQFAEHGAWVSKTVQVVAETRDEPRGAGRYKAVVADLESCVGKWQRAPPQSLGNGKQRWVTEKRRQMRATTFRLPFASVTFLLARSGECELQKAPCAIIVCDGVPKHRKAWLRFSKFSVDDSVWLPSSWYCMIKTVWLGLNLVRGLAVSLQCALRAAGGIMPRSLTLSLA